MKIKGADGHEYNVASAGVGNTGLGLGIAGTALGLLNGGGNGLLGGLLGGNRCGCNQDAMVSRYEATMMQELAAKDGKIALYESNIYTDQKIADVYERLNVKIEGLRADQNAINQQQAVYNGVNTATIQCLQGQVAQLMSLTKLVVPATSICPQPTTTTTTT